MSEEEVVGFGLDWTSEQIVEGFPYERVRAVVYVGPSPLVDNTAFEMWVRMCGKKKGAVARRLWNENKVLQPRLFNPDYHPPQRTFIPWSEFTG